jgi:uncharacterized protein YbcI
VTGSGPDLREIEDEIAREILAVHEESYGVGASSISVHSGADVVTVLIDVELSKAEETLIDAGREEAVKGMREAYQLAIAPTFTAVVERATGRTVASFVSAMSMDPLFSAEVFRLAPRD